jgi:hypothetical protein
VREVMRDPGFGGFKLPPPLPPPPPPPPPPRLEDEAHGEHEAALELVALMQARKDALLTANPLVALFIRFPALKIAGYIFAYALCSGGFFALVEGWTFVDGFYYAMVIN